MIILAKVIKNIAVNFFNITQKLKFATKVPYLYVYANVLGDFKFLLTRKINGKFAIFHFSVVFIFYAFPGIPGSSFLLWLD